MGDAVELGPGDYLRYPGDVPHVFDALEPGTLGVIIDLVILAALSGFIFWRSRATKVDHNNVNAEWTGGVSPDKVPAESAAA